MIAIIRISGLVKVDKDVENALYRLRLRRKYSCVILKESEELKGVIKKIRDHVAYGKIKTDVLIELIEKRGKLVDKKKKADLKKAAEEYSEGKKKLSELNVKPFFRLHPPVKGINSKLHYPKGVLGDNKEEINNLIRRML